MSFQETPVLSRRAYALVPQGPGTGKPIGLGVERLALIETELDREKRVEELQQRWAETAERYIAWLQGIFLVIDHRWPQLDGVALERVELPLGDAVPAGPGVMMYDPASLGPYKANLEAHDAQVREQAGAFLAELGATAADLGREGVAQDAENKFSLFDAARLQELTDGLQEALGVRQAAFAEEAQRVAAAGAAVADFRKAVGEFSERLAADMTAIGDEKEDLAQTLSAAAAVWGGGQALRALWSACEEAAVACHRLGVGGAQAALVRLRDEPDHGFAAAQFWVERRLTQLSEELALTREYTERASELETWARSALSRFDRQDLPNSLSELEGLYADVRRFVSADRPPRMRELAALLDLRADMERTAEFQGRAPRMAAGAGGGARRGEGGRALPRAEEAMGLLDDAVAERSAALSAALASARVLGGAVQRFTADAVELLEWLRDKQDFLANGLAAVPRTKNGARTTKVALEAYASEFEERMGDLRALEALGRHIVESGYENKEKVAALFDRLADGFVEASLNPAEVRLPPLLPRN